MLAEQASRCTHNTILMQLIINKKQVGRYES